MSGFVMSMVALCAEHANPTRAEAAQYLSGNLCRCADYNKILNVAMRAVEYTQQAWRSRDAGLQVDRQGLSDPRPHREGHRAGEVRRGLPRRGDAVLSPAAQPDAARARAADRRH